MRTTSLAVCIPIYNFNVCPLIETLHNQIKRVDTQVELIMIDDASNTHFKLLNQPIGKWGTYITLNKNVGRAQIRNLFLQHTTAPYLLFLDGDSMIIRDNFIANYLTIIRDKQPPVVCGGRLYPEQLPSAKQSLRWRYGWAKESQSANKRQAHPNRSFMTNNFLVQRTILATIPFDERLSRYGHEDTLFGYELTKQSIEIKHIDNPILNGDIESNALFIEKTEAAVENLAAIIKWKKQDEAFINSIQLSRFYFALPPIISSIYRLLFGLIIKKPLKYLLLKHKMPLSCFDMYKLGCLAEAWAIQK